MKKMRVYEYAKANNLKSKQVLNQLNELGIEVSNHMTAISENTIRQLDESLGKTNKQEKQNNQSGTNQNPTKKEATKTVNNNRTSNDHSNKQGQKNQSAQSAGNQKNKQQSQQKSQRQQNNNQQRTQNNNQQRSQHNNQQRNQQNSKQQNNQPNQQRSNKPSNQHRQHNQRNNNKRNFRKGKQHQQQKQPKQEIQLPKKITYQGSLTVGELAEKLGRESSEIIKKLMLLGVMATKNQQLDPDSIELIGEDYGVEVEEEVAVDQTDLDNYIEPDTEEELEERPPVVTIMGHVDHGKTTLLDSIRKTKVATGEAGGITQHIGAYQIDQDGKKTTFLDTPGHAAFTSMRSRGAKVTDIAILVVAADDGVMPQTVEAINHAKAAEVPIIVAVNKMDVEGADPNRVMQELTEYELIPEDWGGETIFVQLSALKNEGIEDLIEMINLVAEVEELKANSNRLASGTVIEAQLEKGRGSVATLLVQNGTLRVGEPFVAGNGYAKVRAMVNDLGERVEEAGPSTPVEVTGFQHVPNAGDPFVVFEDEKKAKQVADLRAEKQIAEERDSKGKVSLDDLFEQIKQGDMKEINIIIKADVQGSAEAVQSSLQKIEVEGVKINIIHTGVGAITESDIILASASNAIVIGFNVRPDNNAKRAAESEKIDIRLHRVIYKAIEEMEAAMKGMLDPEFEEKVIGQAEVRETFKVSKVGTIAGCYVTDGKITRNSGVRIIRDGVVLFEGEIDSLKRFKDDAKEVQQGYECGITIVNFNDLKEGDIIEAFIMEEIERK
ncbi:translation initiation factor IF-2 [Allobacillus sp. GCM10007491]|uniref:Translation initiation factor IF-2 n=1 Tax=Allobacillus saliphilus TaxID=2912308 RepID=A0A941CUS2_9BACI|nr:translation initiation factor IF-2 [Allobacillus saliphilus]MBR7552931.1 translation initiation factor IF-2 [Allobacillus saliphilus]